MSTEKGMSIMEIVFSLGVVVLVISGTVSLMVKSTSLKTSTLQRKNADEVAEKIIEDLINKKNNNRDSFWQLNPTSGEINGFSYSVGYSEVSGPNCTSSPPNCVNAIVRLSWGDEQVLEVKRFFSNLYYD